MSAACNGLICCQVQAHGDQHRNAHPALTCDGLEAHALSAPQVYNMCLPLKLQSSCFYLLLALECFVPCRKPLKRAPCFACCGASASHRPSGTARGMSCLQPEPNAILRLAYTVVCSATRLFAGVAAVSRVFHRRLLTVLTAVLRCRPALRQHQPSEPALHPQPQPAMT
jgi:hypothetical protein